MTRIHKCTVAATAILALIYASAQVAIAAGSNGASGRVLDYYTGAPIEGAFVVALYSREVGFGHSETVCYQVAQQRTGADGAFKFPGEGSRSPIVTAFKRGMEHTRNVKYVAEGLATINGRTVIQYFVVTIDPVSGKDMREQQFRSRAEAEQFAGLGDIYLKRFVGTPEERSSDLWGAFTRVSCERARETEDRLVPYLEQVLADMRALEQTDKTQGRVEVIEGRIYEYSGRRTYRPAQ
jgi:hypothetical protein